MDIQTIANNIKGYRFDKNLTQDELAELANVCKQTIKQIECGKQSTTYGTLRKIATALGVKLADLLQTSQTQRPVLFRSMKKLKNRSVILSVSGRWLDNYEFLEEKLGDNQDFILKKFLFNGSPDILASQVRQYLQISPESPIDDIGLLLDNIGVKLYLYKKTQSNGFFGLSMLGKNHNPAIVVNTSNLLSSERQIFSAVHELGHILMHLDAFGQNENNPEDDIHEKEADSFAGYFLMPQEGFCKIWNATAGMHWIDRVLFVKNYYRVSYQVVLYRLNELHNTSDYNKIFSFQYNKKFREKLPRMKEPFPSSWKFVDNRFSRLVCQALRQEIISISKAAEMLDVSISEMLDIINSNSCEK